MSATKAAPVMEVESDLPEGWVETPFERCADILDSERVPVNSEERAKRPGDVPYYGATGQVGWIDDHLFDEQLLLLGEDGAPFLDKSQPIAYIIEGKSWVNNHAHVLRAIADLTSNTYLKYFLDRFDFDGYVTGSTRLKLTQRDMRRIPVLLPPLAEQKRIVAKVEELLARVNAARDRLARVPAILKRFRQAVLAAACSGRLTADWRANNNVTREATRHLQAIISDDRPATVPSGDDPIQPFDIPDEWAWTRCASLTNKARPITYGVIKLGAPVKSGVPTLRSSDVRWLGIHTVNVKMIEPSIAADFSRTFLEGGEILVTVRGTLGGVGVAAPAMKGFNISREVAMISLHPLINADFYAYAIAAPWSQKWLAEVTKGVAYTGVNIRDLKLLPLPILPTEEQREIVRRIKALFELADAIEKRVAAATARADKLTQAILAKAFRGELVPTEASLARRENRPYEPASALLARIRATRDAANQPPKNGKRQRT